MQEENIVITRDDKSKKLAILRRETYSNFLKKFIEDSKAIPLDKDPTRKLIQNIDPKLV